MSHIAFIGIGSNLGDRKNNCTEAIALLAERVGDVLATSKFYETTPQLDDKNEEQPNYLNAVVKLNTTLTPEELLTALSDIETELGRPLDRPKCKPRTIDLDILFFDDLIVDTANLKIPHPEVQKRLFVLTPLCDIAPTLVHPVTGLTAKETMERFK